jgi:hypothetical protein
MRLALLAIFLSGCSSCKKPREPAPDLAALPAAAPAPVDQPEPVPPTGPADLAGADLPRSAPSDAEVLANLKPLMPTVERCVARFNRPSTGDLLLRFRITPAGKVDAVQMLGLPDADECLREAIRPLEVAPFSGPPSIVEVPLDREGHARSELPRG